MEKTKEDAAENARMLREEASRAKEAASLARAEGARALADAAFEKQRADRQNEYLEEQRLQMQQVTEHSTKYQVCPVNSCREQSTLLIINSNDLSD